MNTQNRSLALLTVTAAALFSLWGCGKSDSGTAGAYCNANGCYNQYGTTTGYNPYSPYGANAVNPNSIVLQSQGTLQVLNGPSWRQFLRNSQLCMSAINSCWGLDGAPGITLVINDSTFAGPRTSSTGNLTVLTQGGQVPYEVNFLKTATGYAAGLQTAPYVQLNYHNTNSGSVYYVQVTGAPSDTTQAIAIVTNGQTIATGSLVRIQ